MKKFYTELSNELEKITTEVILSSDRLNEGYTFETITFNDVSTLKNVLETSKSNLIEKYNTKIIRSSEQYEHVSDAFNISNFFIDTKLQRCIYILDELINYLNYAFNDITRIDSKITCSIINHYIELFLETVDEINNEISRIKLLNETEAEAETGAVNYD